MSEQKVGPRFEVERTALHPDGSWTCPKCKTKHEHPHWKDHHQEERVDKDFCKGWCKESDSEKEFEEDGTPKPLYCPACGWTEPRIQIVKIGQGEIVELP